MSSFRVVENWKTLWWKAWSMRFIAAALLMEATRFALPYLAELIEIDPFWVSLGTVVCLFGAAISRLIDQGLKVKP